MSVLIAVLDVLGRSLVGLFANLLPARKWPEWEGTLPVRRTAMASALLTLCLGFAVGVPGFFRYATYAGGQVAESIVKTAHAVNKGQVRDPNRALAGAATVGLFSLPAFLFFTPLGWLATYLAATGVTRTFSAVTGDPRADPLVSFVDGKVRDAFERARIRREAEARALLEGPEVPDVCLTGAEGGAPEAVYVIVASRQKPDWHTGVIVRTAEGWYRVGNAFDQHRPEGLRRVYPLVEAGAAEVLRRSVAYDLAGRNADRDWTD